MLLVSMRPEAVSAMIYYLRIELILFHDGILLIVTFGKVETRRSIYRSVCRDFCPGMDNHVFNCWGTTDARCEYQRSEQSAKG